MATQDESIQRGKKPVLAVLVILLCIIGISAITYSISMGLVDNDSAIIPSDKVNAEFVDEGGNLMVTGGFSKAANNGEGASRISYTTSYYIFGGERTLGSSKIVIDATQSNATGISLSASVTYKLNTGSTYLEGLPYNMDSKFEYRYGNSTGTVISDSDNITITPGEINTLYVKFIGKLDNNYIGTNQPVSFVYNITFEATSK